jgi:putative transposase
MILQLLMAWLAVRISRHQDHVIAYLLEENRILKAKLKGEQIQLTDAERRRLAVLAHPIDRKRLKDVSTIVTPDTLQRWYRRLVVQTPSRKPLGKSLGRPRVAMEIEQLVVRMATENPRWGYRRIQGAVSNLGYHINKTTVRNILRRHHIDPAPIRGKAGMSWTQFVKLHLEVLEASGSFAATWSRIKCAWTDMTWIGSNLSIQGRQLLSWIAP